jgi:hypothetical protein
VRKESPLCKLSAMIKNASSVIKNGRRRTYHFSGEVGAIFLLLIELQLSFSNVVGPFLTFRKENEGG